MKASILAQQCVRVIVASRCFLVRFKEGGQLQRVCSDDQFRSSQSHWYRLPRIHRKLDNFDLHAIDDLGYLPQGSEVSFTLIAERYERRPLGITSNTQ